MNAIQACMLTGLAWMAGAFTARAESGVVKPLSVRLSVVAVDSAGNAVPGLTASDFKVSDNGSSQQVVSAQLNPSDKSSPVVILFDLLNADEISRGLVANSIKTSLSHLSSNGPVYLYLLAPDASLYPVHALPTATNQTAPDNSWLANAGPLLDAALQKVNQLKPQDFRAASPIGPTSRFEATFSALDHLRVMMQPVAGAKELLWITYGIPSTILLVDRSYFDGVPHLRRLGTEFSRQGTTVYTVDPGLNLQHGILNRDGLEVLTDATGGTTFGSADVARTIGKIQADASATYRIEYEPPAGNWDGKYHKLRVAVDRKGVRMKTATGYYAVTAFTPAAMPPRSPSLQ